jgi:hypothetical protein
MIGPYGMAYFEWRAQAEYPKGVAKQIYELHYKLAQIKASTLYFLNGFEIVT